MNFARDTLMFCIKWDLRVENAGCAGIAKEDIQMSDNML